MRITVGAVSVGFRGLEVRLHGEIPLFHCHFFLAHTLALCSDDREPDNIQRRNTSEQPLIQSYS